MTNELDLPRFEIRPLTPAEGGGYLIVTRKGGSGASSSEIPEGARVVIRDGQAVRCAQ